VECWKKDLPEYWTHEAQERNLLNSFPDFRDFSFNSVPLLQHSNTPTLPELKAGFWPPFRGKSKPRLLGVDSLLGSEILFFIHKA
jgi:hypothetical protein